MTSCNQALTIDLRCSLGRAPGVWGGWQHAGLPRQESGSPTARCSRYTGPEALRNPIIRQGGVCAECIRRYHLSRVWNARCTLRVGTRCQSCVGQMHGHELRGTGCRGRALGTHSARSI